MTFGIVGLGLIGGSFAKAIKKYINHNVYAYDANRAVLKLAKSEKVIDGTLTNTKLMKCDIVFLALYPKATVEYIKNQHHSFKKGCIIIDLCGVKRFVLNSVKEYVDKNDFTFIGGHPMAGSENSGYNYSTSTLFKNSSMILTPFENENKDVINSIVPIFSSLGFTKVIVTEPDTHDKIIAFTSQLAHIVSNSYIKSDTSLLHHGYSAGSYRDLTRVAKLNEDMWSELFLENKDNLADEIDHMINELELYKIAIKNEDKQTLKKLLKDGRERKEKVDNI